MNPPARPAPRPLDLRRPAGLVLAVALAAAAPAAAGAEPAAAPASLHDRLTSELGVTATLVQVDDTERGEASAKALGVQARFGGSLYDLLRPRRSAPRGLRIRDAWAFGFGAGYMTGYTDGSLWFTFRLEATARAVYAASAELDVFTRVGWLVAYDTARRNPGCFSSTGCVGYGDWIVTGGARAGKLFVEAGLGWPAQSQAGDYRMATIRYQRAGAPRFGHVGIRYEGSTAANASDPATHTISLTLGSR